MRILIRDDTRHGEQYVLLDDAEAEIEARVAAERERWIAKAGRAYTEAHARFNSQSGKTPQAGRDVIEWHLHTMRADE